MRLRALISRRSPFLPPLPDDRISLCVYADETGFRYWNRSSDPMPIKTINMAGLQKWEETDDYIIYLDKDAVMTTVANYATGTYDLFLERKADIDGAMELLKINNIEWTSEDDSKLLLDINDMQLERIANTPTTMEEEDFAPQTFTTRTIPTTYEACFRVDKSSGEIYNGEGYENLANKVLEKYNVDCVINDNGELVAKSLDPSTDANVILIDTYLAKGTYSHYINRTNQTLSGVHGRFRGIREGQASMNEHVFQTDTKLTTTMIEDMSGWIFWVRINNSSDTHVLKVQITKTSTPKPFVKSVMPSGKLAFVTDAVVDTHSFIVKGMDSTGVTTNNYIWAHYLGKAEWDYTRVRCSSIHAKTLLLSSSFQTAIDSSGNSTGTVSFGSKSNGIIKFGEIHYNEKIRSFKQLLIYKGNLTEAELKEENEKDIRLK